MNLIDLTAVQRWLNRHATLPHPATKYHFKLPGLRLLVAHPRRLRRI
jgi:hypothetical protein